MSLVLLFTDYTFAPIRILYPIHQLLSKRRWKTYHFPSSFLSIAKAMVYLLFVGRTRRMTQDTASGMHHALACIFCDLMIYSPESEIYSFSDVWYTKLRFDNIQGYALILVRLCAIIYLKRWYYAKKLFIHIFRATWNRNWTALLKYKSSVKYVVSNQQKLK